MTIRGPSRELRGLMLAVYREWADGDPSFLDLISTADDMLLIGTDPDEWFRGGVSVRAVFAQQLSEGLGNVRIEPGELHAVSAGEIGWVIDNPRFTFGDETEVLMRSTVIFAREHTDWKIVHWHVSFGSANEESIGIELTTSLEQVAFAIQAEQPNLEPLASPDGSITIMFTDIESSTELNERLGDERWLSLLRSHDRIVREIVSAYRGHTVKNQGDGYMVAFAAPTDGVRCAVELQRRLAAIPVEDGAIRIRMGLHSGRPIKERDDFFGRDVAYAARVASAAAGGQILVSSDVRTSIEDAGDFHIGSPLSVSLKGFAAPQAVHEVYA